MVLCVKSTTLFVSLIKMTIFVCQTVCVFVCQAGCIYIYEYMHAQMTYRHMLDGKFWQIK